MFRALREYDGSDSSKCITLTPGDELSAVHALDDTWFIGFNERTGEIGAFPIDCVEARGNHYSPLPEDEGLCRGRRCNRRNVGTSPILIVRVFEHCLYDNFNYKDILNSDTVFINNRMYKLAGKDGDGHKMDEKTIYANVSKQIQSRKEAESRSEDNLDPVERSRTLSAHARTFDVNKFRGTKPEKTFRLTLVKKGSTDDELGDPKDPRRPSLVQPEAVFTIAANADAPVEDTAEGPGEPRVRFSDVTLEHSISADSHASWQDSFEMSYESSHNASPEAPDNLGKDKATAEKPDGSKYHKLKGSRDNFNRSRGCGGMDGVLNIVFAVGSSLVILGLMFVVLMFSFGYTVIEAGIIVSVAAVVKGVFLALSPLCRCVITLVIPNLISGKGRAVFLVIMLGILLSFPVLNIAHNVKEAARSLECLTKLTESQAKAVEGQLAKPYNDIANFIDKQSKELDDVSDNIEGALGKVNAHLNNFYGSLQLVDGFLVELAKQCKQVFIDAVNRCVTQCSSATEIQAQCLQACSFMNSVSLNCEPIKDVRKADAINQAATKARYAIKGVENYFRADIQAFTEGSSVSNSSNTITGSNSSSPANSTQDGVFKEIKEHVQNFETFIAVAQKILSFSILLLFLQSFWYTRSYISRDSFDNIYITEAFETLDTDSKSLAVLPLKDTERIHYIQTSSCCPFTLHGTGYRSGIAQLLLHFLLCGFVVLVELGLFHVLATVREFGEKGQGPASGITYHLNVTGSGHVAEFYRILLTGIHLDKSFTMSLNVGSCLPEPVAPSVAIIAVLSVLYCLAFLLVVLRVYGMRVRKRIAAFYYPEHENARLEYLRENIFLKRRNFTETLRQKIKSSHREYVVLQKLSLSRRIILCLSCLEKFVPALNKCIPALTHLRCTGCGQKENQRDVVLRKCTGEYDGALCEATYCEDCRFALDDRCPICSVDIQFQ